MNTIKVKRNVEVIEELDIEFPIYAMVESDEHTSYVKIDYDTFTEIKVGHISYEICQFKRNNSEISEVWINNQCPKEEWSYQCQNVKELIRTL